MTEEPTSKPKRQRRPAPPPLSPGLYFVGRFGELHDITGSEWLGEIADADLAALQGYLLLATREAESEDERRLTPVEINGGHMLRQPDLRDVEQHEHTNWPAVAGTLKAASDAAWLAQERAEGRSGKLTEATTLPPSIEDSLADLHAGRTVPVRRPEVIEETLGTKPVTTRPPMPWDED
jgi:hypothetical protein